MSGKMLLLLSRGKRLCCKPMSRTLSGMFRVSILLLMAVICLAACRSTPNAEQTKPESTVTESVAADSQPAKPPTDEDVLYGVIAGELQGTEGDLQGSAESYLQAALESRDPAVAARATSIAFAAGMWQHAAMAADRWARLAPEDANATQAAASALLNVGDYSAAETHLSKMLDQLGGGDTAWSKVTALLAKARNSEQSGDLVQRLLQDRSQDSVSSAYIRSQLAAYAGALAEAYQLAQEAVAQNPKVDYLRWAGQLGLANGDDSGAETYLKQAFELTPDDAQLAALYADLLNRNAKPLLADQVLASIESSPAVLLSRVLFAIQAEHLERARGLYQQFKDMPSSAEQAFFAGQAAEFLEQHSAALDWYSQVSEGEYATEAIVRRAYLLDQAERLPEARRLLGVLQRSESVNTVVQGYLVEAELLRLRERYSEALQSLTIGVTRGRSDTQLLYTRALIQVELDNIPAAEKDLRDIVGLEPNNAVAINALGYTLADRTDRLDEAYELIQRAYSLTPDEASVIDSMGWVLYRLGRLGEAVTYLREAYRIDKNPEIAAHLGEVLWKHDQQHEAISLLREASERNPEHKILRQTIRRLGVEL